MDKSLKRTNSEAGFTLVELIIVIVIGGILATIVVPKMADLSDAAAKANVNAAYMNMSSVANMTRGLAAAKGAELESPGNVRVRYGTRNISTRYGLPSGRDMVNLANLKGGAIRRTNSFVIYYGKAGDYRNYALYYRHYRYTFMLVIDGRIVSRQWG